MLKNMYNKSIKQTRQVSCCVRLVACFHFKEISENWCKIDYFFEILLFMSLEK